MSNSKLKDRLKAKGISKLVVDEGLLAFYKANGATSNNLNDAEMQYLRVAASASPDKTRMGMWKFLGGRYSTI